MSSVTVNKQKLSGSTNGRGIKVVQTSTPGTLIHTATSDAAQLDEVVLYCYNSDAVDRTLVLEMGGTTAPDDNWKQIVPAGETVLVEPGIPLGGGVVVRAFCATANVLVVFGYVNRITQN